MGGRMREAGREAGEEDREGGRQGSKGSKGGMLEGGGWWKEHGIIVVGA